MRIIIFTWEYPPRIVGKLSEYVKILSANLVKNNVDTHVITYHEFMTGSTVEANINVTRVNNPVINHVSLLSWVLTLNQEVSRAAATIYYSKGKKIHLFDVHDWHFIPAAVTLKNALGIPFVYSVESIENHRNPGSVLPLNLAIRGVEKLGFDESEKVIVKSEWMKNELVNLFSVPTEKIIISLPHSKYWVKNLIKTCVTVSGAAK